MTEPALKLIRIDYEVVKLIEDEQQPRETYNDALRRLLGIEREGAETPAEKIGAP